MKPLIKFISTLALLGALTSGCVAEGLPPTLSKADAQRRLQVAEEMFKERCKTSGEKIYKTVENVEGIFLMKVRSKEINFGDQFKLDDPYGRDFVGEAYFGSFLRGRYQFESKDIPVGAPSRLGYRYVEAIDPQDGKRYRYTGAIRSVGKMDPTAPNVQVDLKRDPNIDLNIYRFVLGKELATGTAPRYGVTYDDISTREEREYWIAGSSLKVIDLRTNEVMAERIGYMMDWAQGSRAGGRSPWLFAADIACPDFYRNYKNLVRTGRSNGSGGQPNQTLDFAEKVLKPSK